LWKSWKLARLEIADQQVLHTGNAETAADGAENTKSKGALIITYLEAWAGVKVVGKAGKRRA
jgi:hypothetical protein